MYIFIHIFIFKFLFYFLQFDAIGYEQNPKCNSMQTMWREEKRKLYGKSTKNQNTYCVANDARVCVRNSMVTYSNLDEKIEHIEIYICVKWRGHKLKLDTSQCNDSGCWLKHKQ